MRSHMQRKYAAEAAHGARGEQGKMTLSYSSAEGISQAGMFVFQFDAAREREKLAKRVLHHFVDTNFVDTKWRDANDYTHIEVDILSDVRSDVSSDILSDDDLLG